MVGNTPSRQEWIVGLFVVVFVLGAGYALWLSAGAPAALPTATPTVPTLAPLPSATLVPRPSPTPRPTHTPQPIARPSPTATMPSVGVVAGHWQSDSGAVCPDGLQEVTINLDVAARVVAILQYEGYAAELLPEFSDRLAGYEADAFVSIHADSCLPDTSGFKVARVAASAIPEEEDRLVTCLVQEYAGGTGLRFHKNSITFDMTGYHAFNEIDPQTPGAIIELGFMDEDRELLTEHSYEVAQAVARGIVCFLEGE